MTKQLIIDKNGIKIAKIGRDAESDDVSQLQFTVQASMGQALYTGMYKAQGSYGYSAGQIHYATAYIPPLPALADALIRPVYVKNDELIFNAMNLVDYSYGGGNVYCGPGPMTVNLFNDHIYMDYYVAGSAYTFWGFFVFIFRKPFLS